MASEFRLPDLGENIESGDVVSLLVAEGDEIQADQPVIELETDKAVIEIPCPIAGRITKIHFQVGDTIKIGEVIVTLDESAAATEPASAPAAKQSAPAEQQAESAPAPKKERASQPPAATDVEDPDIEESDEDDEAEAAPPQPHRTASEQKPAPIRKITNEPLPGPRRVGTPAAASPSTRRLAREVGVDIHEISGTGPGGRISREDVLAAVRSATSQPASSPPSTGSPQSTTAPSKSSRQRVETEVSGEDDADDYGAITRQRMPKIRRTIATNMARSASTIPHVTNFDDADITELEAIRKGSMAEYVDTNVKLTMMSFVIKASAIALRHHPVINASIDLENEQIVYKRYVNVGIAVDTDRGLVVPSIRAADELSIPTIAKRLTELARLARDSKLSLDDLRGGTFTISNLGAVGGTYSTPIINHPEVAILLVGRSRMQPVYDKEKGEFNPRLMMPLSISYDHRLIDGATAARFLNDVIDYLETPGRLLLAP